MYVNYKADGIRMSRDVQFQYFFSHIFIKIFLL